MLLGILLFYAVLSPNSFAERIQAVTILGTIAGALALITNLHFTSQTVDNARRSFDLQAKSQKDERYFRASQQLGDDSEAARIGAIFSLERLAKDLMTTMSR